jgi:hypothetical protein
MEAVMAEEKKGGGPDPSTSTHQVVDLLNSILEEFKRQVQSKTPPPLTGKAQEAVGAFKEITDALDVKPT